MSERVTKVRLSAAVAEYEAGMLKAAAATRQVGTEAERLAQQREAFNRLGTAAVGMGAVIAAGVGIAVKRFADFDEAMSAVQAATHETSANMDLLREAAIEAGASTVFSATEAAGAIEELSKAGVSTTDILNGGLNASLDLAAAGALGVADAAGIAATALKVFNLQGEDMSHVADLLAAGAGKAMGDVQDLAQALAQGGQVAAATGLSIEETTAALSAFAAQGLLGSDAGTSFKTMLQRLTPQSAEAKRMMDELGISAYDASGQFVGLEQFAGNLQTALMDLTPEQRNAALAVMFGSDAVRAANVIYNEGADGIREWTEAVDDQGYAAETAAARLDNLKGDIEALGGALDSALIQTGSAANDTLRAMVQTLTGLVDMYNDLPEPVQQSVLAIGGATAAILLSGGTALLAVPKWVAFKAAVEGSTLSMKGVALAGGGAALALGGLFAILGEVARRHAEAQQRAESYASAMRAGAEAIEDFTLQELQLDKTLLWKNYGSALDAAETLGVTYEQVTEAIKGNASEQEHIAEVIQQSKDAFNQWTQEGLDAYNAAVILEDALREQGDAWEEGERKNTQATESLKESRDTARDTADAYLDAADEAEGLNDQLTDLIDTINALNGVGQDAVTANLNYKDTLAQVDEAIRNGAQGLDENTEAGRENTGMLVDLAKDAQDAAKAQFDLDGNTDAYRTTLEASRQALIDRAMDLGANADEAEALADQIFRIPSSTEWELIAETSKARSAIAQFVADASARTITIGVTTYTKNAAGQIGSFQVGNGPIGRAGGGPVYGPGGPTDDRVPAMLSAGEHVITAEEVRAAGGHDAIEEWREAMLAGAFRSTPDGPERTISTPEGHSLTALFDRTPILDKMEVPR